MTCFSCALLKRSFIHVRSHKSLLSVLENSAFFSKFADQNMLFSYRTFQKKTLHLLSFNIQLAAHAPLHLQHSCKISCLRVNPAVPRTTFLHISLKFPQCNEDRLSYQRILFQKGCQLIGIHKFRSKHFCRIRKCRQVEQVPFSSKTDWFWECGCIFCGKTTQKTKCRPTSSVKRMAAGKQYELITWPYDSSKPIFSLVSSGWA